MMATTGPGHTCLLVDLNDELAAEVECEKDGWSCSDPRIGHLVYRVLSSDGCELHWAFCCDDLRGVTAFLTRVCSPSF